MDPSQELPPSPPRSRRVKGKSAAAISWKHVTTTARSGELSKAVAGAELSMAAVREAAAVHHEGWMVRYGRRNIGMTFFHTRYFVL
jgi:hypothetical protein